MPRNPRRQSTACEEQRLLLSLQKRNATKHLSLSPPPRCGLLDFMDCKLQIPVGTTGPQLSSSRSESAQISTHLDPARKLRILAGNATPFTKDAGRMGTTGPRPCHVVCQNLCQKECQVTSLMMSNYMPGSMPGHMPDRMPHSLSECMSVASEVLHYPSAPKPASPVLVCGVRGSFLDLAYWDCKRCWLDPFDHKFRTRYPCTSRSWKEGSVSALGRPDVPPYGVKSLAPHYFQSSRRLRPSMPPGRHGCLNGHGH